MAKKTEKWADVEKVLGLEGFFSNLTARESAIVGCGMLDVALSHLIERRLVDDGKEIESFLGLDGDGRAPAAALGAKIQLAFLLGLIPIGYVKLFRAFKSIRNHFAHRVGITLMDVRIQRELVTLNDYIGNALHPTTPLSEDARKIAIILMDTFGKHTEDEGVAKVVLDVCLEFYIRELEMLMPHVKRLLPA